MQYQNFNQYAMQYPPITTIQYSTMQLKIIVNQNAISKFQPIPMQMPHSLPYSSTSTLPCATMQIMCKSMQITMHHRNFNSYTEAPCTPIANYFQITAIQPTAMHCNCKNNIQSECGHAFKQCNQPMILSTQMEINKSLRMFNMVSLI